MVDPVRRVPGRAALRGVRMKFTQLEVDAYKRRQGFKQTQTQMTSPGGCEHEADLHADILAECRRRGWLALHGSMAHRAMRNAGEFDFEILIDGGKTLHVEAKTRTGKLSVAQNALHAHARKLGHAVHVVRSLAEFVALITS